ncbi:MAG: multicopper oxidase domain-containing protein, partial [Candidatus Acidiferrales bacterium]
LYHSHTNELMDVNSGLVGAIIVTRRGMADADGKPKDVDREFVCLFMMFDENLGWYVDHNIQAYATDPKGVKKSEILPVDNLGNLAPIGTGFLAANLRFTINGYMFGNGPVMTMKQGERVRWYLTALGELPSFHTPHWHGNTVLQNGHRTDVVSLLQAQMMTVDMVPDDPGTWLFHCHVDDHMAAGMSAFYKVEPR